MHPSCLNKQAFTLVEMLVVIAIVVILTAVTAPSIVSLNNSGQMNQVTLELRGMLEQARQYAVAQNTYVWVAFNAQTSNNIDTISVAMVASMDGSDPGTMSSASLLSVPSADLTLISKVRSFQQFQLQVPGGYSFALPVSVPTTPAIASANAPASASSGGTATFNIQIPGNTTTTPFAQFIQFTPSGEARNSSNPIDIIEFALEPAQNHTVPNPNNVAVVQINGLTGEALVYRR